MALDALTKQLLDAARAPMTRAQAIKAGHLVDCTQAAAWMGFSVPAAMSIGAWDEVVGPAGVGATKEQRYAMGERLRDVWKRAMDAVRVYKRQGVVLPSITFQARTADGRKRVRLFLTASTEAGRPLVTMTLEGEA